MHACYTTAVTTFRQRCLNVVEVGDECAKGNGALVAAHRQPDVALLAPGGAPRVAHQPVVGGVRPTVSDDDRPVVERVAAAVAVEDAASAGRHLNMNYSYSRIHIQGLEQHVNACKECKECPLLIFQFFCLFQAENGSERQ